MKKRHAKIPTQDDIYIGQRICEARIALGMSQKDLAELIGTSYQQLQKYENGTNRVNGSRIGRLVTALNRPLQYFFPNATDVRTTGDPVVSQTLASKLGQRLVNAFAHSTPRRQLMAVELVEELAREKQDG